MEFLAESASTASVHMYVCVLECEWDCFVSHLYMGWMCVEGGTDNLSLNFIDSQNKRNHF